MTYRVEFAATADHETIGLPEPAYVDLLRILGIVSHDPWINSEPLGLDYEPEYRWAPFDGGLGMVSFHIHEESRVVRVADITWTG